MRGSNLYREGEKIILLISYLSVFIDLINVPLSQPIISTIVEDLNSTTLQERFYFAIYSLTMLRSKHKVVEFTIGMLFMGPGSDGYGRKPFLVLSFLGDCIGKLYDVNAYS